MTVEFHYQLGGTMTTDTRTNAADTMRHALREACASTAREIEEWDAEQEKHNYELTSTDDFEYRANLEGTISGYEHALSLIDELFPS